MSVPRPGPSSTSCIFFGFPNCSPLRHTPNTQKLSKNLVDLGGCNEMRLLLADDVAIVVKPKRRVRQR